jgi:hypothetical protein
MEPQPELAAPSISLGSYLRLVRGNGNFRRLWLAQIVSEIGDWFYTLSIYTLLLQLTGHASSVALALVLQVLPQTFVGLTAGVVNDPSCIVAIFIRSEERAPGYRLTARVDRPRGFCTA